MPSSRAFDLCSLVISDDNLYASAVAEVGTVLAVSDIKRALMLAGIVGAFDDDQLESLLDMSEPGAPVLVASGLPPEIGVDARVEYFFETDRHVGGGGGLADKLDWKAIKDRSFVKNGATLARKHAPTKGKDGRDLFGRRIIARNGEDTSLSCGEHVAFGPDGRSLVARCSGVAKLGDNGAVSVADVVSVRDVDLSSGSICTLGSVIVDGNVTDGFTVEAAGDVYIRGNVEGASVVAGGRIVVGGGVRQHGKLDAVGPVAVRFVDPDCSIHTLSALDVVGHAIGAQLSALGPVVVGGEVAGGRCESATHIQCKRAGTDGDVRTLFVVGTGPTDEALAMARNDLSALERRLGRTSSAPDDDDEEPVPSLRAPLVPHDVGRPASAASGLPPRPSAPVAPPRRSDLAPRPSELHPRPSITAHASAAGRSPTSLPARPLQPGLAPRPSLPQRPGSLPLPAAPRTSALPQRPSTSLPARPLPGSSLSSMRVPAVTTRPSQQILLRPSAASMRAAPAARPNEVAITSAKKEFQNEHQLLSTRRQLAFHREHAQASAAPFVLVEEAIHGGVVVRIDREEMRLDGTLFARRFAIVDGVLLTLNVDAPYAAHGVDTFAEG